MKVTVQEFQDNFDKYIEIAQRESLIIAKDGKQIVKTIPTESQGLSYLSGILKGYSFEDDDMDNRDLKLSKFDN